MTKQQKAGNVMIWLTSLFLIGPSAGGKFADWEGKGWETVFGSLS